VGKVVTTSSNLKGRSSVAQKPIRVGVDVGGTFTDLVLVDETSDRITFAKVPTTPGRFEEGVLAAVRAGIPPGDIIRTGYFIHGHTVGLNALLERRGARIGLLSTAGFRDVLEVGRGDRPDPYDLFPQPADPLVPRRLRLEVRERVGFDGTELTPLEEKDVVAAAQFFESENVECVAICFINAYANAAHEDEGRDVLRKAGYSGEISVSHEISREYREYERTTTTVVDAFIRPQVSAYLGNLETQLREAGVHGELLVGRSGGGAIGFSEARARPFESILSGPVGGAQGAAELADLLGLGAVISADVGGTSFDTALIRSGRPELMYEARIGGLPLQTPWVDVRSIGAGGGSIAGIDIGGLLRVGPRSAGADPGPVCYGRGGVEPTVTDAALLLGMLGDGVIAGSLRLSNELAKGAFQPLAEQLRLTVAEAAEGVITIASASMANAIREVTIERGIDPRDAVLVAFGGAGPLFATSLARDLEIKKIVIPPCAGNFSAWGMLGADVVRTTSQTWLMRLEEHTLSRAEEIAHELLSTLALRADTDTSSATREVNLEMRYTGQEHTLTVSAAYDGGRFGCTAKSLGADFIQQYERTFGITLEEPLEIVAIRASLRDHRSRPELRVTSADMPSSPPRSCRGYSLTQHRWMEFAQHSRATLLPGMSVAGPAILYEDTTTTYVDMGFVGTCHETGALMLEART